MSLRESNSPAMSSWKALENSLCLPHGECKRSDHKTEKSSSHGTNSWVFFFQLRHGHRTLFLVFCRNIHRYMSSIIKKCAERIGILILASVSVQAQLNPGNAYVNARGCVVCDHHVCPATASTTDKSWMEAVDKSLCSSATTVAET